MQTLKTNTETETISTPEKYKLNLSELLCRCLEHFNVQMFAHTPMLTISQRRLRTILKYVLVRQRHHDGARRLLPTSALEAHTANAASNSRP